MPRRTWCCPGSTACSRTRSGGLWVSTTGCARSTSRPTWTSSSSASTAAARPRPPSAASSDSPSRPDRIPMTPSSHRAQRDKPYIRNANGGTVAQHFLLTAAARTISVVQVARLGEEEARALFRALRWHATGGDPVCQACGCLAVYEYRCRPLWKCKACGKQFSVTSGTIFHSRKLAFRDYLMAIALFVNGVKGKSALELGRDLDVSYKTAYVLAHKLREAMGADQDQGVAKGNVEVDGAYFGGYVKPATHKENRRDRRKAENQSGKRRVVVVMRERGGRTYPFVVKAEDEAVGT